MSAEIDYEKLAAATARAHLYVHDNEADRIIATFPEAHAKHELNKVPPRGEMPGQKRLEVAQKVAERIQRAVVREQEQSDKRARRITEQTQRREETTLRMKLNISSSDPLPDDAQEWADRIDAGEVKFGDFAVVQQKRRKAAAQKNPSQRPPLL